MTSPLAGKTVALAVTGSIAAYKSVLVARLLVQAGATVIPVLTEGAARFVGPVTFSGITGRAAHVNMWDPAFAGEMHVALAAEADLVLVVPATADALARFAHGRADDLVAALVLSARGRVLVAPAMHPSMWSHPATQDNVATLARHGRVTLLGPVHGVVASGDEGIGRMAEPADIVSAAERLVAPPDLTGVRLVVTAGPTQEAIDPVRFLGNRSSGTMGFAVAERAALRGALVTLIAGPVAKRTPAGVTRVDVTSTGEMREALDRALGAASNGADALVMAAAVADYRPKEARAGKMKRGDGGLTLELVSNPDLLGEIGGRRKGSVPVLVGFALETETGDALVAHARGKLAKKKVDLIVANSASVALGGEDNQVTLVSTEAAESLPPMSKLDVADAILDFVRQRLTALATG